MKKRWIALMTVWAMLAYVLAGCGGTTASSDELEASYCTYQKNSMGELSLLPFYLHKKEIRIL